MRAVLKGRDDVHLALLLIQVPLSRPGVLIFYGDNVPDSAPIGPIDDLELLMIEGGLVIEKALLETRLKSLESRRSRA